MLNLKKGVNLGGWLSQCPEYTTDRYENFITESDIKDIAAMHCDHVRLPIDYQVIETEDGYEIADNYRYIDNAINWCRKFGLKTILDVHRTWGYSFDDAGKEGLNTLFSSSEAKDRFLKLWNKLSARYGRYSDSVAMELLNEVVNPEYADSWNELIKKTVSVIRKNAPDTTIIYGGVEWNSANTLKFLEAPADDNTIFTFHYYEPLVFTHQKAPWVPQIPQNLSVDYREDIEYYKELSAKIGLQGESCAETKAGRMGIEFHEEMIADALRVASEKGLNLYCGEFGVIDRADPDEALKWYRDMITLFKKHNIGYCVWSYKEMDYGLTGQKYAKIRELIAQS